MFYFVSRLGERTLGWYSKELNNLYAFYPGLLVRIAGSPFALLDSMSIRGVVLTLGTTQALLATSMLPFEITNTNRSLEWTTIGTLDNGT